MVTFEGTLELDRPVEAVWGLWERYERFPRFLEALVPDLQAMTRTGRNRSDGTDEFASPESAVRGASRLEWSERLRARRIRWSRRSGIPSEGELRFVPVGHGSSRLELRIRAELGPPGTLREIGTRWIEDRIRSDLDRFERLVVGGSARHSPERPVTLRRRVRSRVEDGSRSDDESGGRRR